MKVKIDGKWSKHRPVAGNTVGYRAEGIRLNGSDLADICNMSDRDLAKTIRHLSARVNRFHNGGFVSTPTGRTPIWPTEMQSPSGTRSQEPRRSSLVDADFSEIEKRVAAALGIDEKKLRYASPARQERKRAETALELWREANRNLAGFWIEHVLKAALDKAMEDVQTQIDEEGCGAAFAALKEWK